MLTEWNDRQNCLQCYFFSICLVFSIFWICWASTGEFTLVKYTNYNGILPSVFHMTTWFKVQSLTLNLPSWAGVLASKCSICSSKIQENGSIAGIEDPAWNVLLQTNSLLLFWCADVEIRSQCFRLQRFSSWRMLYHSSCSQDGISVPSCKKFRLWLVSRNATIPARIGTNRCCKLCIQARLDKPKCHSIIMTLLEFIKLSENKIWYNATDRLLSH